MLTEDGSGSIATLGGPIRVSYEDHLEYYLLTAGHIFQTIRNEGIAEKDGALFKNTSCKTELSTDNGGDDKSADEDDQDDPDDEYGNMSDSNDDDGGDAVLHLDASDQIGSQEKNAHENENENENENGNEVETEDESSSRNERKDYQPGDLDLYRSLRPNLPSFEFEIGYVAVTSRSPKASGTQESDHDWALISLSSSGPTLLDDSLNNMDLSSNGICIQYNPSSFHSACGRPVVVLTSTWGGRDQGGLVTDLEAPQTTSNLVYGRKGCLGAGFSFLMLSSGTRFAKTYSLKLSDSTGQYSLCFL